MEYCVGLLWIGLDLLCIFLFESSFLKKKHENKLVVLALFLSWLLLFLSKNISFLAPVSIVLTFLIMFCVSCYVFAGKWYYHIFLPTVILLFSSITDTAVVYGASAILQITPSELIWMKATYSFVITMGKLIVLLCVWLLYRFKHFKGLNGIRGKWFALAVLFPIVSFVILALNYYNNLGSNDLSPQILSISIILALANVGIVYLLHTMEQATIQEQEFALLKQQMIHQQENFTALENSYRLQRKSAHEFERHIQTLNELLGRDEYDTVKGYIAQLQKDRALRIYCINTHHPVLDVILNQKYQVAKENGINVQIQINDLSPVKIQTDALVILFSNLLDNAIEACQHLTVRREIRCTILYDESLYVSVCNTSLPVKIENGIPSTNKPHSIDHGYGIPAVQYIMEQLNAEYTFDYKDGWFQFVAEIPPST